MLFQIFAIYKGLLSLGDRKVIEVLLSNAFYLDTFGALECTDILSSNLILIIDDPEVLQNNAQNVLDEEYKN
jgi:hypothetical protein